MVNNIPRGSTLFKSGEYIGSVNFIGNNTRSSSSAHIAGSIVNTIGSVFLAALAPNVSGTSSGGGAEVQPTREQEHNKNMMTVNIAIARVQGEIDSYEAKCTSPEQITTQENEIKQLEADLNADIETANGKYVTKETVQKYIEADKKFNEANTNYKNAQDSVIKLQASVDKYDTDIQNVTDSDASEKDKNTALTNLRKQRADKKKELDDAEAKKEQAKVALDEAKKELVATGVIVNDDNSIKKEDWQNIVDAKLDDIAEKKNKLVKMKATQKTNAEELEKKYQELSKLEAQRDGYVAAYNAYVTNEVLENAAESAKYRKAKGEADAQGKEYTKADAEDGTWLSRTWQKTKGLFSKSAKEKYNTMKDAHKNKKYYGEQIENLGINTDPYKAKNVKSAANKTSEFVDSFGGDAWKKLQNLRPKIAQYYRENPDASNAEVKKKFNISDDGTPMS